MAAAEWSWADNKIFEDALVKFPEEVPNRWQMIAGCLPGKSPHDVIVHYNALLQDVADIEAGLVQLPPYSDLPKTVRTSPPSGAGAGQPVERKKGKPWSPEEHMLFLRGLDIYGKSDWRSISRNVVKSRLPSQVASHAQKYFNRQKSGKKERKRSSIHDITSVSYPSTEQLPYTTSGKKERKWSSIHDITSVSYPSTEILPYTTSKAYRSTELLPYTTSNGAYPSTEQSAYTAYHSTDEILPYTYTTSKEYPSTTSKAYPSTEQSSYNTNTSIPSEQCSFPYNVHASTESSPSSMNCLAFRDINNIGTTSVMAIQDQTDDVVPAPNPYNTNTSMGIVYHSEQCSFPYNVHASTESSPSSMDCLAFRDINNIGTASVTIQDQTDDVVLASNPYNTNTSMGIVYPSEQCSFPYNVHASTESSPSSMDFLAFRDINNICTASVTIQDQTDDVVTAPNPYIHESYPIDYSFGEFNPLQM